MLTQESQLPKSHVKFASSVVPRGSGRDFVAARAESFRRRAVVAPLRKVETFRRFEAYGNALNNEGREPGAETRVPFFCAGH